MLLKINKFLSTTLVGGVVLAFTLGVVFGSQPLNSNANTMLAHCNKLLLQRQNKKPHSIKTHIHHIRANDRVYRNISTN